MNEGNGMSYHRAVLITAYDGFIHNLQAILAHNAAIHVEWEREGRPSYLLEQTIKVEDMRPVITTITRLADMLDAFEFTKEEVDQAHAMTLPNNDAPDGDPK